MNPLLIPLITSLLTSGGVITAAWITSHQNRKELRGVKASVHTRNGDSVGENLEELFKRTRRNERDIKIVTEGQDDLLEGFAFVAAELGRVEKVIQLPERRPHVSRIHG